MASLPSTHASTRAANRRAVLSALRRNGPTSRAQLAELTSLSPAAMSSIAADLVAQGVLLEQPGASGGAGRPPILLALNAKSGSVIGLKVMKSRLEAVLTDLAAEPLAVASLPLGGDQPEPGLVVDAAELAVKQLRDRPDLPPLLGVGLALPGVMDGAGGVCSSSPLLGWRNVPIAQMVQARLNAPVVLDNDVNALAAGEMLFGRGRWAQTFLVVTVGSGIGAGLVMNGQVHHGRDGGAGELGHTLSEPGGRYCDCGRRGCLEAQASVPALVAQYLERHLERRPNAGPGALTAAELAALAAGGDEDARALISEAGTRLGLALAGAVNLLNPNLIILGGEGLALGNLLVGSLRDALINNSFPGLAVNLPIITDPWSDVQWARGAASLAAERAWRELEAK